MQFIRVFATLLAFAAASTLASPIPADSLVKKGVSVENSVLAREPGLEVIAREPEDVEAREPSPICTGKSCL